MLDINAIQSYDITILGNRYDNELIGTIEYTIRDRIDFLILR